MGIDYVLVSTLLFEASKSFDINQMKQSALARNALRHVFATPQNLWHDDYVLVLLMLWRHAILAQWSLLPFASLNHDEERTPR
jgi:hypothetical protein